MRRPGCLLVAGMAAFAQAPKEPPRPGPRDLCPVCGMNVAKYPAWQAAVVWKDGGAHHFDGAKDLFKFLQAPGAFLPGRKREGIGGLFVTEFYGLKRIPAEAAWYVVGSDVLGPMGHELVPFESAEDAAEFMKDHKGRRVLRFGQVTGGVTKGLDSGQF
ncbi:MAG: nitrous oxide reductase accessory protein NosL [Holophaga sp.]|nr:nitrous oxide reductase accessory protein NosL [Holophaga sp.]